MHLREIHLRKFKRFTDTRIQGLPERARLVVLCGPNGSGKSSLFDGLKTWHWYNGAVGASWDESYGAKAGEGEMQWPERVQVQLHEPMSQENESRKKTVYVRSAFRNEADFQISGLSRLPSPLDSPRIARTIDNDMTVSENYTRLIMATIDGVYSDSLPESITRVEIRDRIIGRVEKALSKVFPDLFMEGVGGALLEGADSGTFYFTKGTARKFLYKNLSAGEKSAFDLILDFVIKAEYFDDSIWCIDEPESHLNTQIQARLLDVLIELLPVESQLILATHSIGFMRRAWELARAAPESVVFVDMQDIDFDEPQILEPTVPSRVFWERTLKIALGDLAALMAPERVVLCEGRPPANGDDDKAEFDAACYRTIFSGKVPETDFISIGNRDAVEKDRLSAGKAIQTIVSGTEVIRVIDRDSGSPPAEGSGVRVLSRRNLEGFLLDKEVIAELFRKLERPNDTSRALEIRSEEMARSVAKGQPEDDWKKPAARIYDRFRRELNVDGPGRSWSQFAREVLAPLIKPGLAVYAELDADIFGQ